ncbi:hypothetical protein MMC25_005671 [Agyrium rufum]|nr:hypothetical protein [Agyrium rufum]
MLASLLRPRSNRARPGVSPLESPFMGVVPSPLGSRRNVAEERQRAAVDYDATESSYVEDEEEDEMEDEYDGANDDNDDDDGGDGEDEEDDGLPEDQGDEDEPHEASPLLPIFESAHLDVLPVYNLVHAIRTLVVPRCETTLTWDQLRSPQVSQFLVKPIQQQIITSHFSSATLYALMANCLQFNKEAQTYPGLSGTSRTRALVCELLAMRLLKEFSTRELIDALSYDFFPLQGATGSTTPTPTWDQSAKARFQPRVARISALEISIRAQAKRFLAHPLVVQQLEGIWAGSIVFHSVADNMHRSPAKVKPNHDQGYGAIENGTPIFNESRDKIQPAKQRDRRDSVIVSVRRSVILYDPQDASLFKLSRLRVPRYREVLSTLSLAVLLGLFLAVLAEQSLDITALEIVFWFWSAGFMLDEIVGFNEQGFSLYILSFWNAFDLGILLLLICYYCMRLYGILMSGEDKDHIAGLAYDILAANAVLLFPRLFSILDHYRYFSQLLIAFRMMAMDLVAVFILIVISCSGFFIAFTLSFNNEKFTGNAVIYALFQMLMGFTPAAWEQWDSMNWLGKAILTLFLFICHFLIVTILITVLTNSFMAIVQNANEEHQFLFAVNTISMVKSDALFSYIAPTNVFAWLLTPLRYFIPFRDFVRINRTVIKTTHFPILFAIYGYERFFLSRASSSTELIEERGRTASRSAKPFEQPGTALNIFSPSLPKLREPSVTTFHKDRALAEVFRRPMKGDSTVRVTQQSMERRQRSSVVNNWMQTMGPEGRASPPQEQDRSVVDRLEARQSANRRSMQNARRPSVLGGRVFSAATRSIASDPEEFVAAKRFATLKEGEVLGSLNPSMDDLPQQTDADGDDELVTNDDDNTTIDQVTLDGRAPATAPPGQPTRQRSDYFTRGLSSSLPRMTSPEEQHNITFASPPKEKRSSPKRPSRRFHDRKASTNTILYNPLPAVGESSSEAAARPSQKPRTSNQSSAKASSHNNTGPSGGGTTTPHSTTFGARKPPRRPPPQSAVTTGPAIGGAPTTDRPATRARPIMPPRTAFQSTPNLAEVQRFGGLAPLVPNDRNKNRRNLPFDIGSDIGDNKAVTGGFIAPMMPASFATQMEFSQRMKTDAAARAKVEAQAAARLGAANFFNEDQQRMSKLMLARMNMLEQGFRAVVNEVKDWRKEGGTTASSRGSGRGSGPGSEQGDSRGIGEGRGKDKEREKDRSPTKRSKRPKAPERRDSKRSAKAGKNREAMEATSRPDDEAQGSDGDWIDEDQQVLPTHWQRQHHGKGGFESPLRRHEEMFSGEKGSSV